MNSLRVALFLLIFTQMLHAYTRISAKRQLYILLTMFTSIEDERHMKNAHIYGLRS